LFRGIILSSLAGTILAYPYLKLIRKLNFQIPWRKNLLKRFSLQFPLAILAGIIITPMIVIPAGLIFDMEYDFQTNLNNAYYLVILSLFLMITLEALIHFDEGAMASVKAETLEKELSQIRFEVLKSQINPHFMFNSLNVLSGLINTDVSKAQQFIDEFSHIYRYVLETIEQPVASLSKELDFTRSYLFLQQIRYGQNLSYTVDIPANLLELVLPPLSLQVVLENTTKHNLISESKPLKIEILSEGFFLIVRNNIQPKISKGASTGLGLKNLVKRYVLISKQEPIFKIETNHYVVKLPLINLEDNEHTDH
jgi:LytS/YehU family sensor histidine kinase